MSLLEGARPGAAQVVAAQVAEAQVAAAHQVAASHLLCLLAAPACWALQASFYHADADHEIESGGQMPHPLGGVCDGGVAVLSNQISICCEELSAVNAWGFQASLDFGLKASIGHQNWLVDAEAACRMRPRLEPHVWAEWPLAFLARVKQSDLPVVVESHLQLLLSASACPCGDWLQQGICAQHCEIQKKL